MKKLKPREFNKLHLQNSLLYGSSSIQLVRENGRIVQYLLDVFGNRLAYCISTHDMKGYREEYKPRVIDQIKYKHKEELEKLFPKECLDDSTGDVGTFGDKK